MAGVKAGLPVEVEIRLGGRPMAATVVEREKDDLVVVAAV